MIYKTALSLAGFIHCATLLGASTPSEAGDPSRGRWHTIENHLSLWTELDENTRPVLIGREIEVSVPFAESILRDSRPSESLHHTPSNGCSSIRLRTEDGIVVAEESKRAWNETFRGQEPISASWTHGGRVAVAREGDTLHTWIPIVQSYDAYSGAIQCRFAYGTVDLASLLGDELGNYTVAVSEDQLTSTLIIPKIYLVPKVDNVVSKAHPGFVIAALPMRDASMTMFVARLTLKSTAPSWPKESWMASGPLTDTPPLYVPKRRFRGK